jgi:Ion transport protein
MDTEEMEELEMEITKLEGSQEKDKNKGFLDIDFSGVDCEVAMYFLPKQNKFRRFCYACIKHPKFESIILFFIMTSSLKLVVDTYIVDGSDLDKQLKNVDYLFNGIFIIEASLKIISLGFFVEENTYLSESWSKIDFFIVFTSIIDMSFDGIDISFLKV